MTEQEYLSVLRQIRAWIVRGDAADLRRAEEALEPLRSIYPKRLSYVAAETALMLAKGEAAEDCRKVIDYAVQEVHPQEGLADLFALKGQTYAEGTPERRQLDFLVEFYTSGVLPQKPFAVLDAMRRQLRTGGVDADGLRDLAEQYYVTRNVLFSLVLMMAWCRLSGHMGDYENYVLWDAGQPNYKPGFGMNYGFLARMLADGNSYTFLLLAGENDDDIPVLAMALRLLGHEPSSCESAEQCMQQRTCMPMRNGVYRRQRLQVSISRSLLANTKRVRALWKTQCPPFSVCSRTASHRRHHSSYLHPIKEWENCMSGLHSRERSNASRPVCRRRSPMHSRLRGRGATLNM